jgi:hypothetical protein
VIAETEMIHRHAQAPMGDVLSQIEGCESCRGQNGSATQETALDTRRKQLVQNLAGFAQAAWLSGVEHFPS